MASLTYTDLEGGAPVISWRGREFTTTIPVEVDPEKDRDLIEAAKSNRFFAYDDKGGSPKHDETIVGKGEAAARDGKKRVVPPAYRGDEKKPQAEAWLYGYDRIPQSDDPYRDPGETAKQAPVPAPASSPSPQQPVPVAKAAVTTAAPVSPTQALQAVKEGD